ncbi:MAG: PH domain-containing protein [Microbacteriaceae bacterium]|nr:PH domain-containing protein [Microbacteriaceae bacterium]
MQNYSAIINPDDPERLVVKFRRHGRNLTLPVIALWAAAALGGRFIGSFEQIWANLLVAAGVLALVILGFLVPFLKWLAQRTIITTRRVIVRSGVITRSRSELAISRVRSVSTTRGPHQRMIGSGNIALAVIGDDAVLDLHDVPGINNVAEVLRQLTEASHQAAARAAGFYTAAPGSQNRTGFPGGTGYAGH